VEFMGQGSKQTLREWLPEFLVRELAPYPGRWSVVVRMIIAAVLTMIVIVTFRIPYGAIGVNCAFILSRENLRSTAKSGFYFIFAFAAWVMLLPVGARMFASVPLTHFLWEGVTVFVCFFLLKTLTYFPLATGVVVVGTATLAIWYLPGPAELNIELTLWQILATAIGAAITIVVEVVFRYFAPENRLTDGIRDRLRSIEMLLESMGGDAANTKSAAEQVMQYAVTGASMLRQEVAHSHLSALERSKRNALIALVGRSIDISAGLAVEGQHVERVYRERAQGLAARISALRRLIGNPGSSERVVQWAPRPGRDSSPFSELETTIHLVASVVDANGSPGVGFPEETASANRLFVGDAFSNPEYLRFALAGTAASMLCYIIYVGLNWPGISTAVTTCALTALSDIGSSRQKQLLRIVGASIGGFVFGLGSQIFILPYVDTIVGLAILFAFVTGVAAYVATSSPRLSYVGLQIAFAFYLINATSFNISLDLTIGRDRAVGVLLGIAAMWFVFERLFPRPAAVQMVRQFARSARLLASLNSVGREESGLVRIRMLRDEINSAFASVNAEADAVLFESGEQRPAFLAGRDRIRRWLVSLRTLYLLELPLLPFHVPGDGEKRTLVDRTSNAETLLCVAGPLMRIAEYLEKEISSDSRHGAHAPTGEKCAPGAPEENASETTKDGRIAAEHSLLLGMALELERDVLKEPIFKPADLSAAVFSGCQPTPAA
jgi:multidrug resistance protein MdtO